MQIVPTILPGSYPSKVTQPDGYNPSPLPPPSDYYVSKKEILDNFLKRNPSVPKDTIPTFDSDGQLKSSSKTIKGLINEITAKVTDGATEAYDTLKEIEAYITEDKSGTAAIIKDLGTKATKTELETEVSRAKEAETALGKRVGELEENGGGGGGSSVEVVVPAPDGAGKAADAKVVYDEIRGIYDNISDLEAADIKFEDELGKKQSKLTYEQLAAANSGITAEKVSKLDGVEAGAQKNPDLSGYAKKTDIPVVPDLTDYAKTAEVPAAIAGKEIKPSSVVMELESGFGWISKFIEITPERIHYVKYSNEDDIEKELFAPWDHIINAIPKYDFVDYGESGGEIRLFPFSIRRVSGVGEDISILILPSEGMARDMVLVVDATAETHILWEDGATTFHPRGGDAANLEVVAGKRNVFFITEVQPNVFMVARDELALPNEGGGE
jgi:hypothetical protein